ncbi:MAG: hypothetical protein NVS9B10_16380 [Nevskia sp.]
MAAARKVNFRFGDIVQLESAADSELYYRVQLVGVLPGLTLLVTAPDIRGQLVPLNEGDAFSIRIFNGDDALAFTSHVVRCCREPYPYVHLAYPQRIEWVQARNARRARLKLPAQISVVARRADQDDVFSLDDMFGKQLPGTIRDLSTAGAQIETGGEVGEVGTRLIVMTSLSFDRVPGRTVLLPAEVRNVKRLVADDGSQLHCYGVQFLDLPAEADLALSAFVYRHLAAQLLQDPAQA